MRRIVMALRSWSQEAEGDSGLSGAQLFVLQKLGEATAPSLTDLARRTFTSKAAVSVVVTRLVRAGLVRRDPSPLDRRGIALALTLAGRAALKRAPESPQSRLLAGLHELPPADVARLAGLLERWVERLGLSLLEPAMLFEPASAPTRRPPRARGRAPGSQPLTRRRSR